MAFNRLLMQSDNVLFLGSFYPKERQSEFKDRSAYFDIPGNILQWAMLGGLSQNCKIQALTAPSTKKYKSLIVKESNFSISELNDGKCIGFIDVPVLKDFIISNKIYKELLKKKPKYVVVYSIQLRLLRAAYMYKKRNPQVKVVVVVTDLPLFMRKTKKIIYNILKKIENTIDKKYLSRFDGSILLSKHMKEYGPLAKMKNLIIEGIYNPALSSDCNNIEMFSFIKKMSDKKTILYTGDLSDRYGIPDLIKSFIEIENKDYRLILCGKGVSQASQELIKKDSRISYMGCLHRDDILMLQKNCTLLINPRKSAEVYTKYSFPSKTMEYMASGRPVLMSKLESIPEEYYEYLYFFKSETHEGIKDAIISVLSKSSEELIKKGLLAKDFVCKNKNIQVQGLKMIEFLKLL